MTEEVWRDIPGYEGLYQVSDLGRVRSLDRVKEYYPRDRKAYTKNVEGRILKLYCDPRGYRFVGLQTKGERERFLVHRLMAMAFLENPDDFRDVVFKDGDRSNIVIDNLMWMDHSEASIKARRGKVYE